MVQQSWIVDSEEVLSALSLQKRHRCIDLQLNDRHFGPEISRAADHPTHRIDFHCDLCQKLAGLFLAAALQTCQKNVNVGVGEGETDCVRAEEEGIGGGVQALHEGSYSFEGDYFVVVEGICLDA